MKSLAFSLVPLVVSAAPGVVSPRQLGGDLGGGLGGLLGDPVPVESIQELPGEKFPEAKKTITRWGPYQLVGHDEPKPEGTLPSMDPNGQAFMSKFTEGICHDCTVLGGIVTLQLADGRDAMEEEVYIHHLLTFDTDKTTDNFVSMCPTEDGKPAEGGLGGLLAGLGGSMPITPFIGVGQDNKNTYKLYTTPDRSFDSGYHVGPEDTFMANADLVNYGAEPVEVFITLDMEYVDGKEGIDAFSTLLRVRGCGDTEIVTDPNGPANTTSLKYPILSDGNIVSARGHLHTGGVAMVLFVNDEQVCVSEATYGGGSIGSDGNEMEVIKGMSDCNNATPVKKGDYLTMTSIYDLAAHPPMAGGGHSHGGGGMGGEEEGGMGGGEMGMWSIIYAPVAGSSEGGA